MICPISVHAGTRGATRAQRVTAAAAALAVVAGFVNAVALTLALTATTRPGDTGMR